MNGETNSTMGRKAPDDSAADASKLLLQLEEPIFDAATMAQITGYLAERLLEGSALPRGLPEGSCWLTKDETSMFLWAIYQTEKLTKEADKAFRVTHLRRAGQ